MIDLSVTIDGVDESSVIDWRTLEVEDVINDIASVAEFEIKYYAGQAYRPNISDEVIMTDNGTSEKVFAGNIISIKESSEGAILKYKIKAKDYTAILDRIIITEVYESMTINAIIADIISNYLSGTGVTGTNVSCTKTVTTITFNAIPVSKAIQILAEQVNYSWYIDYDKDFHFFAKNSEAAAFNLSDTGDNFITDSLELEQDISQMRNVVIVRGGDKVASTTRTKRHVGDGSATVFNTDYKFASTPTVTVGGVSKTVGEENLNTTGYDCYWDYNQKYIRFDTAPASSAVVLITGYPLIPIIVQVEDLVSVSEYGRFEYKKVDKSISSTAEAKQYAEAQIEAYGASIREGSFRTYDSGLKSGQTININLTDRGINENFVIQRVSLKMRSKDTAEWSIELATLRTLGIIAFLQGLLLSDSKKIELDEGEVLEKYYQINEEVNIDEEVGLLTKMTDETELTIDESILKDPFGAGVKPDFVYGPYVPTSDTDANRVGLFDRSYFG